MERRKSRSVYRLPNFTKAQRAAYYGLPYMPTNDVEEYGKNIAADSVENQNESSIVSYIPPESLIDAFISPGKTPKATDAVDEDVEMMEVDEEEYQKSFVSNQPEPITTSSQPPLDFRAPQTQPPDTARVMTSRLSLLLPRFMQPTTSSSARTSKKPFLCSSPICSKRTNPPPLMAQEARAPATTCQSLQKPHSTPRKYVAVCRKVLDQSFNAPKLPVLDVSQFKEFQPIEKSRTSGSSNDPESQILESLLTFADEKESSASHSDESVKTLTLGSSNILEDIVSQTPTSSKNTTSSTRIITESPIDHDSENAEPSTSLHRRGGSPIDHDFDFANPSTNFNSSIFSLNTPGSSRSACPKRNPLIPANFRNESNMTINDSTRSNKSVIKITAAQKKNDKKGNYVLAKPKLVKPHSPEIDELNLRRSQRTRVRPLRSYLNEVPIYDRDKDGLPTLVDITTVEVKNSRAKKYLTVDPGEQIEREKALKKRQKSRQQFAKIQRERENDL
uniref:Uncharacterized protein n=1 Tax=Panagrolaimus davidi TaxID=227884 RepID=A0A914QFQ4_9BILA